MLEVPEKMRSRITFRDGVSSSRSVGVDHILARKRLENHYHNNQLQADER